MDTQPDHMQTGACFLLKAHRLNSASCLVAPVRTARTALVGAGPAAAPPGPRAKEPARGPPYGVQLLIPDRSRVKDSFSYSRLITFSLEIDVEFYQMSAGSLLKVSLF